MPLVVDSITMCYLLMNFLNIHGFIPCDFFFSFFFLKGNDSDFIHIKKKAYNFQKGVYWIKS